MTNNDEDNELKPVLARLDAGQDVRVACFGDSITAVHYHTGSRMAYPDLVGRALQGLYPRAQVRVVNAGVSGHNTRHGLERMDRDVLAYHPHLVTVMFGMNDQTVMEPAEFAQNLRTMTARAQGTGAAVLLCTQNNMRDVGSGSRSPGRLALFTQAIRDTARELGVPVADSHAVYEEVRLRDEPAWRLLLLDAFHPALHGHRIFTRTIVRRVTGQEPPAPSLANTTPALPHVRAKQAAGEAVTVTLLGLDGPGVGDAVLAALGGAGKVTIDERPIDGLTAAELVAQDAPVFKAALGDLVLLCPPADPGEADADRYGVNVELLKYRVLPFGNTGPARDCAFVLPAVVSGNGAGPAGARDALLRHIADGADAGLIERAAGDGRSAGAVIAEWLARETRGA